MKRTALLLTATITTVLLVAGVALAATLNCGGGDCLGTTSDDRMYGSDALDNMAGLSGDDLVVGRLGDDSVKGGYGNDRVYGFEGNDKAKGGYGRDVVYGNAGDDVVRGTTYGENDNAHDELFCGPGIDEVYFVPGQDTIHDCETLHETP